VSGGFRALLVGVTRYDDDAIDDLPFVEDDLRELADALAANGYEVETHDPQRSDRDSIEWAVEDFLDRAPPGETLLLYLSGHGVHSDGVDYLVPGTARTRTHNFPGKCLSLDFSAHVERSGAGDVVVFVDACREGITLMEKGGINTACWSDMKVRRTGSRHYCHVYACSPGEKARYVTAGNSTFSLFSRALSTVLADESAPGTLREIRELLQSTLDGLTAEHDCRRQEVRISAQHELDTEFVVVERPESTTPPGEHPWVKPAREHPVWEQVKGRPGADAVREATLAMVAHLGQCATRDECRSRNDPWRPVGFAERMTDRVGWLLSKALSPEKLDLSAAEAALLVIAPFMYVAHTYHLSGRAAEVDPENLESVPDPTPERAEYEDFLSTQGRLVRRARRARERADGEEDLAGIAWWLFRRWEARQAPGPDVFAPIRAFAYDTAANFGCNAAERRLIAEVLDPDELAKLLRALQTSPDPSLARPVRELAGSTSVEQSVRDQLVVVLLAVAHGLAIDPIMLPDVIVDHLGISFSVSLSDLGRTLDIARWDPHNRTRVLNAACRHPAVGLALRQHAATLDALLGAIDVQAGTEPQLAALRDLPVHATADQVRAATDARGNPMHESTYLRFRLADDRIQELLMGEQLYGDPALAIRELYQNALDACRYRGARSAFLARRRKRPATWHGKITFTEGEEDGRAYIECSDNGIGMGDRELRHVFSHAGMRFADLPEFVDEQAEWRAEGVEIFPNSRFGIGVLSYFMIADDITVTTCRLDRDGHAGSLLEVDIAGPGALFRIKNLGRGYEAGTTVRLYLRSADRALSCTDLLGRLLWLSEYAVTATDARRTLKWLPGELSDAAPLGSDDPDDKAARRDPGARIDATSRPDVWWCSTKGGVLSDGLWAGIPLFGAVVDLKGRHAVPLTVDRRTALRHDDEHVRNLVRGEIPALLASGAKVLDHTWLYELGRKSPDLADAVLAEAVRTNHSPWMVDTLEVDVALVGCFAADAEIFDDQNPSRLSRDAPAVAGHVMHWRLLAYVNAGVFSGMSVATPHAVPLALASDEALMTVDSHLRAEGTRVRMMHWWLAVGQAVPPGHVLGVAAVVGRRTADVITRLRTLGYEVKDDGRFPERVDREDARLLSRSFNAKAPWIGEAVSAGYALRAALAAGIRPEDVVSRLGELGLPGPTDVRWPDSVEQDDAELLSRDLNGFEPWLPTDEVVPAVHVAQAAVVLDRPSAEVVSRLQAFGFAVQDDVRFPNRTGPDDLRLLSRNADGSPPWLTGADEVSMGHIMRIAIPGRRRPEDIVLRIKEFGLTVQDGMSFPEHADPDDLRLMSRELDGRTPWLDAEEVVSAARILRAVIALDRSPRDVTSRLIVLGFVVADDMTFPGPFTRDDARVFSANFDGRSPWLSTDEVVTTGHVLAVAAVVGWRPEDVVSRLRTFGLDIEEGMRFPAGRERHDLRLLSRDLDERAPWLKRGEPVPLWHVLRASGELEMLPNDVAARLFELGYTLPEDVIFDPPSGAETPPE